MGGASEDVNEAKTKTKGRNSGQLRSINKKKQPRQRGGHCQGGGFWKSVDLSWERGTDLLNARWRLRYHLSYKILRNKCSRLFRTVKPRSRVVIMRLRSSGTGQRGTWGDWAHNRGHCRAPWERHGSMKRNFECSYQTFDQVRPKI